MEKIKSITVFEREDEKDYCRDKIHVQENGNLHFDSYDIGELPEKFFNHDDYESNIYVDAEWKDSILLLLLKERFKTNSEFQGWADEKKLPYTVSCWP